MRHPRRSLGRSPGRSDPRGVPPSIAPQRKPSFRGKTVDRGTTDAMCDAIFASLTAGAIWAAFALLIAASVRYLRARPFKGEYDMFEQTGARNSVTVIIEHRWWRNLIVLTPVLRVVAEHTSGPQIGAEEFSGYVEVLSLSDIANGFYWYRCRDGGALRLVLSNDRREITEYGNPHRRQEDAFVKVLRRRDRKLRRSK